jgi:putative tryptophan/tyrosine transport system substrate-binding protein
MSRRISVWLLATFLLTTASVTRAQTTTNMPRIGWLSPSSASLGPTPSRLKSFRQGLAELGYVEGKNIVIEYRYAQDRLDRLPELAAELVRLRVNVLVTTGNESTRAAKEATQTIPIVMGFSSDPVGLGFVATLARPAGNITGLSSEAGVGLAGKRIELLKEAVPSVSSVFALWHQASPRFGAVRKEMDDAARTLGIKLQFQEVKDSSDLDRAFLSIGKGHTRGVVLIMGAFMRNSLRRIVDLTVNSQLPAIYTDWQAAEAGGLMAYGAIRIDEFRRAAIYVDKILNGAKPADLPVEQPTRFELIINLKTAKQIGLTIPPHVLARANRVIK